MDDLLLITLEFLDVLLTLIFLTRRGEKCIFLGVNDQSKAYKLYNPITKKIVISCDVVFDEERFWPWNSNTIQQQIPTDFDGENEKQQPVKNLQQSIPTISAPTVTQNALANSQSPPVVEEQRPQRDRRRPTWMIDYEVIGVDQSEVPLTHFDLFSYYDPTVLKRLSKNQNGLRRWMKKLQQLKETILGSWLSF